MSELIGWEPPKEPGFFQDHFGSVWRFDGDRWRQQEDERFYLSGTEYLQSQAPLTRLVPMPSGWRVHLAALIEDHLADGDVPQGQFDWWSNIESELLKGIEDE